VIAARELAKARTLFNQLDFDAAYKLGESVIKPLDKGTGVHALANTLRYLGQAYAQWERFEWKAAAKTMTEHLKARFGLHHWVDVDRVNAQALFCRQVGTDLYGTVRLADLHANAQRRFKQGRYDDAMARLYRAYEYLVQIRLMTKFGINTSTVTYAEVEGMALCQTTLDRLRRRVNNNGDGKLKPGLREGIELLAELQDPVGEYLVRQYWSEDWKPQKTYKEAAAGKLQAWLKARNDSYLAHGTKTIDRGIVRNLLDLYANTLKIVIAPEQYRQMTETATFLKLPANRRAVSLPSVE